MLVTARMISVGDMRRSVSSAPGGNSAFCFVIGHADVRGPVKEDMPSRALAEWGYFQIS